MRKRNESTQFDLTEDEVAVLRMPGVPNEVRAFLGRQHEAVGTRITAYEKVAASARAERLALQEIRRLGAARDAITDESEYRVRISQLEGEKREIASNAEDLRLRLMNVTALPAAAVHSSD